MKACTKCGQQKPLSDFYRSRRSSETSTRYSSSCKQCTLARQAARVSTPEGSRKRHDLRLRRVYGTPVETYDALYLEQGGACAVCNTPFGKPVVDHCHTGGHVRGLLCFSCNILLGHARDDKDVLLRAVAYLEKSQ